MTKHAVRPFALLAVSVTLSMQLAGTALAGVTPLPSQTVLFDSNRQLPGDSVIKYEIYSMNSDGTAQTRLTNDLTNTYDTWWARPSPDRTKILFVRTPRGTHDTDFTHASVWVMNADGTGQNPILPVGVYGWGIQGHPEWSPDGTKIATVGGAQSSNAQIYIVNADGTNPMKVTGGPSGPNRPGTNVDPSWSRDGTQLLFIGCPAAICTQSMQEVYRVALDGSGETRLTNDSSTDNDPYYSPDGSTIAWLRNQTNLFVLGWGIYRMNPDGSGQTAVIDDGQVNSKPAWSLDGKTIYFHRTAAAGLSFNVWSIKPDGTGLTQIITPAPLTYSNEYPAN